MIQAAELDAAAIPAMFVLQELMILRYVVPYHKWNSKKVTFLGFKVWSWCLSWRLAYLESTCCDAFARSFYGCRNSVDVVQGQRWNFLEHGGTGLELKVVPNELEWRSFILVLAVCFQMCALCFSHQSRSAVCHTCFFTCRLCGRSVRVCVWSKWSLNVPQLCSTLPVRCRQGWPSLAATADSFPESETEKLSGGQMWSVSMMKHDVTL